MPGRTAAVGPHHHRSLGVTIASTHPVPGLPRVPPAPARIVLRWHGSRAVPEPPLRGAAWRVHPVRDERGRPVLSIHRDAEGGFHLAYADDVRFRVRADGGTIDVFWPDTYTLADAAAYLVGPVLGFARRLQGATTLHGAAAVIRGRAVAFLGASGAGKSTLVAALARRGHRVLCDDAACIGRRGDALVVEPGASRVRLWDDSADALLGDAARAPVLSPSWDKRALDLTAWDAYADAAAPLGAIFLLDPDAPAAAPAVSAPLGPAEALVALVGHGYGALLQDAAMRAAEFARLARVAERLPVRRLRRDADLATLPALVARVERALGAATPSPDLATGAGARP